MHSKLFKNDQIVYSPIVDGNKMKIVDGNKMKIDSKQI